MQGLGCVFLGICVELAWHDWKQATLKAGFHLSTSACDTSACWVHTSPPCSSRESLSSEGLGQGARIQCLMLCWGQQVASFLLSPRKGKVAVGNGDWGCVLQSHQPCHCSGTFREEEEEEKKGREEVVKLLRSARERREEGGWSLEIFFAF